MSELARATGTSPMTIRRDLVELERQGMLRRTHGGAVSLPARGTRLPYTMRAGSDVEQKRAIAVRAAAMIPDGSSVILDIGTTCAAVAQALAGRDITVLALSVGAAVALGEMPGTRIITPGGELDGDELAWMGHRVVSEVRAFRADYAVFGVCAWDEEGGLTATSTQDVDVKRAIRGSARHVIAVATPDKLGVSSTFAVCPTEDIETLVTCALSPESRAWLAAAGVDAVEE